MMVSKKVLAVLLIAALLLPSMAFAKDNVKIAKVLDFSGDVQVKKGGDKLFKVFKNMGLTQGDTIVTGRDGKTTIELDKDKEVVIGPDTQLLISELVSSIKAESGKTSLNLLGGKVMVNIKEKLKGDSKFEIKTPTSVMGVRGTTFYVNVDPMNGRTYLGVFDGVVWAGNRNEQGTETGSTTEIYANEQMSFDGTSSNGSRAPQPLNINDMDSFGLEELVNQLGNNPEQINVPDLTAKLEQIRNLINEKKQQEAQRRQQREQQQQQQASQKRVSYGNTTQPANPASPPPVVYEPVPTPEPENPPVEDGPRIIGSTEAKYFVDTYINVYFKVELNRDELVEIINKSFEPNSSEGKYHLIKRESPYNYYWDDYWDYYLEDGLLSISSEYLQSTHYAGKTRASLELLFASGKKISLTINFTEPNPLNLMDTKLLSDHQTVEFTFDAEVYGIDPFTSDFSYLENRIYHSQINDVFLPVHTVNSIKSVQVNGNKLLLTFNKSFIGEHNRFLFVEELWGQGIVTGPLNAGGMGEPFNIPLYNFIEAVVFALPYNDQEIGGVSYSACNDTGCESLTGIEQNISYEPLLEGYTNIHVSNSFLWNLIEGYDYVEIYTVILNEQLHLFTIDLNDPLS